MSLSNLTSLAPKNSDGTLNIPGIPPSVSLSCVRKLLKTDSVVANVGRTGQLPHIFHARLPGTLIETTGSTGIIVLQRGHAGALEFCSFKKTLLEVEVWSDPGRPEGGAPGGPTAYYQDENAFRLLQLIRELLTTTGNRSAGKRTSMPSTALGEATWNATEWWPCDPEECEAGVTPLRVHSVEVYMEPGEFRLPGDQKQGDGLVRYRMLFEVTHD